jgi:hypothetical protein
MCFLYFLHDHLGFSVPQIINAGAATLAGVFTKLTGRTDAFNEFVGVLKNHYPQSLNPPVAGVPAFISYTIPGDDVFPVANLTGFVSSSLGAPSLDAGSAGTPVVLGLDRITPLDIIVALSSDDPALLSVPASVTIPAGNNSAGTVFAQPPIEVAAAPVPGPARTVAIHATYAGKTVTATVVMTPP